MELPRVFLQGENEVAHTWDCCCNGWRMALMQAAGRSRDPGATPCVSPLSMVSTRSVCHWVLRAEHKASCPRENLGPQPWAKALGCCIRAPASQRSFLSVGLHGRARGRSLGPCTWLVAVFPSSRSGLTCDPENRVWAEQEEPRPLQEVASMV